jgi:hypothetical protein
MVAGVRAVIDRALLPKSRSTEGDRAVESMIDPKLMPRVYPWFAAGLAPFLRRPISPQRWARWRYELLGELHERASLNGTTAEEELLRAAAAAARIAQLEGRSLEPRQQGEWMSWYRRRIQELVTDDLLGPGWRERELAEPIGLTPEAPEAPSDPLEASSELAGLRRRSTAAEEEFLELWLSLVTQGWDAKAARIEAGARTGRDLNAVRQLVFRIRRNVSRFSAE